MGTSQHLGPVGDGRTLGAGRSELDRVALFRGSGLCSSTRLCVDSCEMDVAPDSRGPHASVVRTLWAQPCGAVRVYEDSTLSLACLDSFAWQMASHLCCWDTHRQGEAVC